MNAAVAAALAAWGRIDVLVNNAWAGPPLGRVEWKTTDEMEKSLRVGFLSNFWSMQAVFPHMKKQGGGRIVNLCSLNGVNAHMYTVHYNAAKEAVRALTRTAAREWAGHNILCNVICPAAATETYRAVMDANPAMEQALLAQHPMHRMGDPEEDIGGVALFLATRRLPLRHRQHALRGRRLAHQRLALGAGAARGDAALKRSLRAVATQTRGPRSGSGGAR